MEAEQHLVDQYQNSYIVYERRLVTMNRGERRIAPKTHHQRDRGVLTACGISTEADLRPKKTEEDNAYGDIPMEMLAQARSSVDRHLPR